MSRQVRPRILRYSRPPSLSTINSNEESNIDTAPGQRAPFSPYTGGAENRNSIVSPITEYNSTPHFARQIPHHDQPQYLSSQSESEGVYNQPRSHFYSEHHIIAPPTIAHYQQPTAQTQHTIPEPPNSSSASSMTMSSKDEESQAEKTNQGTYLQTRWMWMLLQLDEIPTWHNVVTSLCAWIILAAYLVLPGTFTTLKSSDALKPPTGQPQSDLDRIAHVIATGIDNLGLAVLSALLASIGALGLLIMCMVHWKNALWLSMKIFMPVMLNSFAGLLTTMINVYTAQKGVWSLTAKINAIVSGSVAGLATLIYCLLTFFLLKKIKQDHANRYPDEISIVEAMKEAQKKRDLRRFFGKRRSP